MRKAPFLLVICVFILIFACHQESVAEDDPPTIKANGQVSYVDLDGNGAKEPITFEIKENAMLLTVGENKLTIPLEGDVSAQDPPATYEQPTLHLLNDGPTKRILLSVVWNTNKIGIKADLWLYEFKSNKLPKVWDNQTRPEFVSYTLSDNKEGTAVLEIPQYDLTIEIPITEIPIDKRYYDHFLSTHLAGEIDVIASTMYYLNDCNNDNITDLIVEKILSTGAIEWLPFRSVYEVYTFKEGEFSLINVVPLPSASYSSFSHQAAFSEKKRR